MEARTPERRGETVSVVGVGTARTAFLVPQAQLANLYDDALSRASRDAVAGRRARRMFRASGIRSRQFAIPDFTDPGSAELFRGDASASTAERMRAFARRAPELAEAACRRALERADVDPARVDHLVVATCTGVGAPDLDVELASRLRLSPAVERTQIVWMSCSAGFPALRVARRAAALRRGSLAVVVCVELCSLHARLEPAPENLLAHALFADGAGALVLASGAAEANALAVLGAERSELALAGRDALRWEFEDDGFRAHIDRSLPGLIGARVERFVAELLPWPRAEVASWCVHPGGRAILDAVSRALDLDATALESSRAVLRSLGNMSSASIVYVLERELERCAPGARGVLMGFGTGLTLEGLCFRRGGAACGRWPDTAPATPGG